MPDDPKPTQDEIEKLEEEADDLEDRAERDGVIPDEDDIPDHGVGPQTGVVP